MPSSPPTDSLPACVPGLTYSLPLVSATRLNPSRSLASLRLHSPWRTSHFRLHPFFSFCYFPRFMRSPEELAREEIDKLLTDCGWTIQNRSTINFSAARGVALRE